ncbi:MAG TPA: DUF4131 domain-containing protein, partial [Pyrinomonadaceae bacterium]|nr:DUF4131 domain-containing protein [Pyrinomonadaceae bacterium]
MNPHLSLFSQHPLAQLAVAFSLGICAANYLPTKLGLSLVACAVCSVITFILVLKKRVWLAGVSLLVALFFAGETLALLEKHPEPQSSSIDGEFVVLTGVLDGPPEFARDRLYLSVQTEHGRMWLLAPFRNVETEQEYRRLQLRYGTRIRVNTTLDRTGKYRNPGVSTLSEYLDRRDYDATGIIKTSASIVRLDDTSVFRPLAWLYDWRERLQREIDSRFTPETAGVLDAALLGNRYNLS